MSKASKSCGYTGHMKIMNRVNQTKIDYTSHKAQEHQIPAGMQKQRPMYPEVAAEQRAQSACNCSLQKK